MSKDWHSCTSVNYHSVFDVIFSDHLWIEYFFSSCFAVVSSSELPDNIADVNKVDDVLSQFVRLPLCCKLQLFEAKYSR